MPLNIEGYEIRGRDVRLYEQTSIVRSGLILHLDASIFNTVTYGTTWFDISGNGNNGTMVNGPTYNSGNGGGIILDGVNDYINRTRPSEINFAGTFTFEVWMKFNAGDSIGGGAHIIGSSNRSDGLIRSGNGFNTHLTIDGSNNLKVFTFNGGGGDTDYDTGFNISIGEICQVGMIHNSGTNKAGVKNGVISTFQSRWSTQNPSYLIIGGQHDESGFFTRMNYPNITIYSVRIYNRALSAAEILHNYNVTKGRFGL